MKIGIVGFGTFGQFLAKAMTEAGYRVFLSKSLTNDPPTVLFQVTATSRTDYTEKAKSLGVIFFSDSNDFAEDHPDIVVLCTSIISLESIVKKFPFHRLRRSCLVVDVLSVKVFPKHLLLKKLPKELDILCTHPMFGPDSGKVSWKGLRFMYEIVRVGNGEDRSDRIKRFVDFFRNEGCQLLEMSCEEHDRKTASTQFITHTVGRILKAMDVEKTNLDTKGFESLLALVDNTQHDSFDLYYGLFMYNQNATDEINRLENAFESVKKQLFKRLHEAARERLFYDSGIESIDMNVGNSSIEEKTVNGYAKKEAL